ncbi:MAG: prepilin-type N-terminal cleavage/methylation domain-containing protein [Planctomycetota bacterium]
MRRRLAFSLMELLAVVAILGIVAAVIIPRITDSSSSSKVAVTANDFRLLANAAIQYRVETGSWPADVSPGITPTELAPYFAPGDNPFGKACPLGGSYDWNGHHSPPTIWVIGGVWESDQQIAVDALLDDGSLGSGNVRNFHSAVRYTLNH